MEQLALELGTVAVPPATVIARCNEAAYRIMGDWPRWPQRALMVRGPVGSGKSHLARVFVERRGGRLVKGAALRASEVLALAAAPVAVDDVEEADERALFHLLNAAQAARTTVLLTGGTRSSVTLADLASRLRAVPEVTLAAPDDALLQEVLTNAFQARQLSAEPSVIAFLMTRMERTLHAAQQAVAMMDQAGLAQRRGPTRPLAARVLEAARGA